MNTVSIKCLVFDLFSKESPLEYFLPYKCSQDHAELTFSCIRSAGGTNNNPNALQLKWILRKLLFRNSVSAGKNSNCSNKTIEDDDGDVFHFGIFSADITECGRNNRSYEHEEEVANGYEDDDESLINAVNNLERNSLADFHSNILYFISGSLVKKFINKYPCEFCENLLLNDSPISDHTYHGLALSQYISFTAMKSRGKLLFVSAFEMEIVTLTEKIYKSSVIPGRMKKAHLKQDIMLAVQKKIITSGKLRDLNHPTINSNFMGTHELKIVKCICSMFLNLRIHFDCKNDTLTFLGKKSTLRTKLHNTILFSNV